MRIASFISSKHSAQEFGLRLRSHSPKFRHSNCTVGRAFSLTACFLASQIGASNAISRELSSSEFIKSYRAAAEHLADKYRNIRVVGVIDTWDGRGETELRGLDATVLRVVKAAGDKLDARGPFGPKAFAQVKRYGPDYGFHLAKPNADKRYHIVDLRHVDKLDASGKEKYVFEKAVRVEQFLKAPVLLYQKTIDQWLDDDGFRIESVEWLAGGAGNDRVEVEVKVPAFPDDTRLESCKLTFLPNLSWVLAGYEARYTVTTPDASARAVDGTRMTYASPSAKENLFPDSIEISQKDRDTGEGTEYSFKTNRVEIGTVKPKELTLPAFGLRDIASPRSAPNYWLIVGLAVAVPLALFGVYWVVKRRKKK